MAKKKRTDGNGDEVLADARETATIETLMVVTHHQTDVLQLFDRRKEVLTAQRMGVIRLHLVSSHFRFVFILPDQILYVSQRPDIMQQPGQSDLGNIQGR